MAKLERILEVHGEILTVPRYVNRTPSGWQIRKRDWPSRHFSDSHFGGAKHSLKAAVAAIDALLIKREREMKNTKV